MSPRAGIIAGKSVIVVQVQDTVDAALNKIGAKLNKFSAKVSRIGFEMFSGGFLGTLGLTSLGNQFKDFEDKLLFLSTKLQATDKELAAVEATIRSLGRSTSFTASEVADGATILAQAGFKANEVIKLLQPTLDLARGAQIDLSASGAILANTLRSFSLETEKATEVASQFVAAARLGTLDVLDLKESIKEVLGTVRNLNIDLPTTLALITQLAERSLKGTKAGTSLNTALLQLASKGKQLAKLGLVLPENLDGPGFIKFLEELYKQINKMGNLKRTAVLQSIFNIRGGRAITALDDIKKIIELHKEISKAGDEARKAAITMDSGFGGSLRRASSAVEGLTLRLGKLLSEAIIPTLDLVPALSLALEQLTAKNQLLVTGLLVSPIALLGLGAGLLTASFAAGKLAGFIGLLAGSLKGIGDLFLAPAGKNGKGGIFTQQMTMAAIAADKLKRTTRGLDTGLSALLLTPQLVGGRGRNARKIKPTSFFGRVGKTKIPVGAMLSRPIIALASKATAIFIKLIPTLNILELGLLKVFAGLGKVSTGIASLAPPLATLVRLFTSLSALVLTFVLPGSNQLTKTTTFLTAINAIRSSVASLIRQARGIKVFTFSIQQLIASIRGFDYFTAAMNATAKLGSLMRILTLDFTGLERVLAKSSMMRFLVSLSNYITNLKGAFAFGNLAKVLDPKPLRILLTLFKSTTLAKKGASLFNLFKKSTIGTATAGLKVFTVGIKTLFAIDFVRLFLSGAKAVWSITKAFGALAAISFRTLTTLSGWGNILTFLILFGPKIKFIREAFIRLGSGIAAAFRSIGLIGTAIGPAFTLIARSMKTLLAGNGALGFEQLTTGLSSIVDIVGNQLSQAWDNVALAIAPAYDFMSKLIQSTMALGELFTDLFGITLGKTFSNINDLFKGGGVGGGLSEIISSIFAAIDMKGIFEGMAQAVSAMALAVNEAMRGIYNIIAETMRELRIVMITILGSLPTAFFGTAPREAAERLAGQKFKRFNPATGQFDEIAENFYQHDQKVNRANKSFDKFMEDVVTGLGKFQAGINNIFGGKGLTPQKIRELNLSYTESGVQQWILELANELAERLSKSPKGPFSNFGQLIGRGMQLPTTNPFAGLFGASGPDQNIDAVFGKIFNRDNLTSLVKNTKAVVTSAATKVDPAAVAKAQIPFVQSQLRDLRKDTARLRLQTTFKSKPLPIQPPAQFAGLGVQKTTETLPEFLKRQRALKQIIDNAQRAGLLKDQIRELRRQARGAGIISAPQRALLSDIVSSTTGSFQQTRRNLVKLASGQSVEQKSLSALEQIQDNTSATTGNLDQILQFGLPVQMGLK